MDIERAKELLPIIQAFSEGKKIEMALFDDDGAIAEWSDVHYPKWLDNHIYRIKQEPKYRPFKDADECWEEMKKHEPIGWLINKNNHGREIIESIGSMFTRNGKDVLTESIWKSYVYIFENYTFADGTPFGVKMEE